jgi:hypothetical protein
MGMCSHNIKIQISKKLQTKKNMVMEIGQKQILKIKKTGMDIA